MKNAMSGLILAFCFGMALASSPALAEDTVVVGQPYYGYGGYPGYYGGAYGAPFFPGAYLGGGYGGYDPVNPAFAAGGGNPYFIMGLQRQAGAVSNNQVRNAQRLTNTILYAPVVTNPNAFDGPYVNYNDGVYSY